MSIYYAIYFQADLTALCIDFLSIYLAGLQEKLALQEDHHFYLFKVHASAFLQQLLLLVHPPPPKKVKNLALPTYSY